MIAPLLLYFSLQKVRFNGDTLEGSLAEARRHKKSRGYLETPTLFFREEFKNCSAIYLFLQLPLRFVYEAFVSRRLLFLRSLL